MLMKTLINNLLFVTCSLFLKSCKWFAPKLNRYTKNNFLSNLIFTTIHSLGNVLKFLLFFPYFFLFYVIPRLLYIIMHYLKIVTVWKMWPTLSYSQHALTFYFIFYYLVHCLTQVNITVNLNNKKLVHFMI